jgi:uncharacterized damage-inducible protein DinB
MIDRHYCIVMASYNRWMNERLYASCAEVGDRGQLTTLLSQLGRDPGVTDLPFAPGIARTHGGTR